MKKLILILCLISIGTKGFSQENKTTAAVLELEALEGISKGVTTILSNYLRNQIVTLGDFTIVTRENMEQVLREQKFQLSGCTSQECMVQAGQLLGVRKIFAGSIGKVGKTYILEVKLIDVETGKIESAEIEECPKCEEDALINSIKNLAIKVVKPSLKKEIAEEKIIETTEVKKIEISDASGPLKIKGFGSLYIDSFPKKDGKIYLNSVLVGKTPLSLKDMKTGVYRFKFYLKDYAPFEGYVQVPFEGEEKVYLKVDEKSTKRIENPGYAYETKFGIGIVGGHPTLPGILGILTAHFPYLVDISGGIGFDFIHSVPAFTLGILGNLPFDWWLFQYGFIYTHLAHGNLGDIATTYGFVVGIEIFLNSSFSSYFRLGPAFYDPPGTLQGQAQPFTIDYGFNYYFLK